jgi:hypothetical protein
MALDLSPPGKADFFFALPLPEENKGTGARE